MNQVLEQRYVDKQRLFSLLTRLFAIGAFSVEDTGEHYIMTLPRGLTQDEIQSVRSA